MKNYYGSVLQDSNDLKTNTCTTANAPPRHLAQMLGNVHDEVRARYYGCGLVYPALLAGTRVLDLGLWRRARLLRAGATRRRQRWGGRCRYDRMNSSRSHGAIPIGTCRASATPK